MRGPSSSHCAAAVRIGKMARDLMDGMIKEVIIEFHPSGSLATTHKSQGSDMGLFAGLLGWDATDERLVESEKTIKNSGIGITQKISDFKATHPNTYKITLANATETHRIIAVSTGGGVIEITEIDNTNISMAGDYFETLIFCDSNGDAIRNYLLKNTQIEKILLLKNNQNYLIEVKSQQFLHNKIISELKTNNHVQSIKTISPVMPVLARKDMQIPFITCGEMLEYNKPKNLKLWELAVHYESNRGNMSYDDVFQKMKEIVQIMQDSIQKGIEGTEYENRILGYQSGSFKKQMERNNLLNSKMLNQIILYVTAMMEMKSSMGIIVAAPTAGSCGALAGACIGTATAMGLSLDEMTKAMLAAGIIGIFIAAHSTFAAEVCGCQAECGAGSGMAAAALVCLGKGSVNQAVSAASMALQNVFGLTCDPVANRVEVPCLSKNVMAAANALVCANMALADFDEVIPLDEVIVAMDKVGKSLPHELRCTALGGLSVTETSRKIEKRLG
jgi:L-serine dehydratase